MTAISVPAAASEAKRSVLSRVLGRRTRDQDPRWLRAIVHLILVISSIIAVFHVIRVIGVALRPGDRLLDPNFSIIPEGATLEAFRHVLF